MTNGNIIESKACFLIKFKFHSSCRSSAALQSVMYSCFVVRCSLVLFFGGFVRLRVCLFVFLNTVVKLKQVATKLTFQEKILVAGTHTRREYLLETLY